MLKAIEDVHDLVEKLEVHCYDSYRLRKGLSAKYQPASVDGPRSEHGTPWKDIITIISAIVKFPSLKRSHELPVRVRSLIGRDSTVLHANTVCRSITKNENGA